MLSEENVGGRRGTDRGTSGKSVPPIAPKRLEIREPMPLEDLFRSRNSLRICRASSSIDLPFSAALMRSLAFKDSSIFRKVKLAMFMMPPFAQNMQSMYAMQSFLSTSFRVAGVLTLIQF
jgi:hypothetical protein